MLAVLSASASGSRSQTMRFSISPCSFLNSVGSNVGLPSASVTSVPSHRNASGFTWNVTDAVTPPGMVSTGVMSIHWQSSPAM